VELLFFERECKTEVKDDPKERASIVGFEKRFIAVPVRNKRPGAIVSALVNID
jgi:hypothetical protein